VRRNTHPPSSGGTFLIHTPLPDIVCLRIEAERARAATALRVGRDGESVAAVAREFGVGLGTVMAAVRDHARPLVDDPTRLAGVGAVGVDETGSSLRPRPPGRRNS
jgi:hypothetical protein